MHEFDVAVSNILSVPHLLDRGHEVARLGGFIGRKPDSELGWQTLLRGWQLLQDLCWSLPKNLPG